MPSSEPIGSRAGGVVTSQSPPFGVPVRYMMLGILCFGLFAIDVVAQSNALSEGVPGIQNIVAVTHLLTLGALLSFVMGAVYQLATVAFLIPIASVRAARWNFWLYVVSLAGLFSSMQTWWGPGLLGFGLGMVTSICIYAGVILASLRKTTVRGPMLGFVSAAHVYLLLAITIAVLLVLDDSGIAPGLDRRIGELVATHILFAIGGFFTFLVMGFSFKLIPMFTLSHGFRASGHKWTLIMAHTAIWLMVASAWGHLSVLLWAGAVVGIASLVNHIIDIRNMFRKRLRKKIEPPIRAVVLAAGLGVCGLGLLIAQLVLRHGDAGWQTVTLFYLLGSIALTVVGFAYKIVPFLVWTHRYSKQKVNGKGVLISDLINVDRAWPVLFGFAGGLVILTICSSAQWPVGSLVGALILGVAIISFCVQLFSVIELNKTAREWFRRD